jgi:hypothetical protein
MPLLHGLPGRRKPIEAEYFKSAEKCAEIVRRGIAATAFGENGAINVWPVKGGYRGHFLQFHEVVEDGTWPEPESAFPALRRWLRQIRKPNARAAAIKAEILAGRIGPWERGE